MKVLLVGSVPAEGIAMPGFMTERNTHVMESDLNYRQIGNYAFLTAVGWHRFYDLRLSTLMQAGRRTKFSKRAVRFWFGEDTVG